MFSHIKELFTRPSGYTIARSVRLRSSASGYFSRTPSASSRTTWTWTAWVKRGKLGSAQALFSAGTGTAEFRLTFTSSDTIEIYEYTSPSYNWQKITTAVYRDPSAWYQIQLVYDTTNGTAGDRVKLYVNSVQVTLFGTNTNPTPSFSGYVNSAVAHGIGSFSTGSSYLDGYLTEANFIDGQALTPSSFGETDSITGVWKAKKYSGTYGTNGFYLNFSDNSSNTATTIGKDYSGNGNNWTPNNISVTSGVTYDSMVDSPTVSAVSSNYAVLNPLFAGTSSYLTNGNLNASVSATNTSLIGTIQIPTSGKWYWEYQITTIGGGSNPMGGIATTSASSPAVFYRTNGDKLVDGTGSAYGATYTTTDTIGVAVDVDGGTVAFYKNNTSQGNITYASSGFFPALRSSAGTDIFNINFGQRPFTYTPPTGFVALNTYNLPASTITNGAAYMAATLYTGNGTSQTITNAGGFAPDLVWIKGRSYVDSHTLFDTVRGATQSLSSNTTTAEVTRTTALTAFTSTGFTVSSDTLVNYNANTLVGWQWKAGGSSSSNTNGSITSTVSAGATQGFSVATYTGNGSAGATFGHGLGVAPSFVIIKERGNANGWLCYHISTGNTGYLELDATLAFQTLSTFLNNTTPSSSVVTLGTVANVNRNGGTFVAYCFAAVAGYSAFGSYTGNGSNDGPFVYTGFRPRFVLIKDSSSGTANWLILDSSRSTYNLTDNKLAPNLSDAENSASIGTSGINSLDILSNGFKLRTTYGSTNANGDTYIYACFAENPLKYALAR